MRSERAVRTAERHIREALSSPMAQADTAPIGRAECGRKVLEMIQWVLGADNSFGETAERLDQIDANERAAKN